MSMIATNRSFDDVKRCQEEGCGYPAHRSSQLFGRGPYCAYHECHKLIDAMLSSKDDDDVTELMPELFMWIERARLEAK